MFLPAVASVAVLAGAVASIAGFGIGSFLTPLFASQFDVRLAVALVAIPHFVGTAVRFWLMREHVDWALLKGFGLTSAAGGLAGALLFSQSSSLALGLLFGGLLVFVGISGLSGLAAKMRFEGVWAWLAGALSGLLGGMVGNQGGIRSGAMLGLGVDKNAFVATATAIGLIVDLVRLPVYLISEGARLADNLSVIFVASALIVVGTLLGRRILDVMSEAMFRRLVSGLILGLGLVMIAQATT